VRKTSNLFSRVYRKADVRPPFVLGLAGSPRKSGNSEMLLDKALEAAVEENATIKKIRINDLQFIACQDCAKTRDDGVCKIDDDFQTLYDNIIAADIVVLASPIYFGSVSAQVKTMIDRFQCHWQAKHDLKDKLKKGAFICVQAADRHDFFENARQIVKHFFSTIQAEYSEELFCSGAEQKDSVQGRSDLTDEAIALGVRIVRTHMQSCV